MDIDKEDVEQLTRAYRDGIKQDGMPKEKYPPGHKWNKFWVEFVVDSKNVTSRQENTLWKLGGFPSTRKLSSRSLDE